MTIKLVEVDCWQQKSTWNLHYDQNSSLKCSQFRVLLCMYIFLWKWAENPSVLSSFSLKFNLKPKLSSSSCDKFLTFHTSRHFESRWSWNTFNRFMVQKVLGVFGIGFKKKTFCLYSSKYTYLSMYLPHLRYEPYSKCSRDKK